MDISIVIVNWNSLAFLRDCLSSVYETTHGLQFEIIVVDNASPEGGIQKILCDYPDVRIIENSENLGFARANNLGFQFAMGEYVLLLNPDTKLLGSAIENLLAAARELPDAGIIGGKLLNSDMSVQTQAIQTFPTILNQILNIEALRCRWPNCFLWKLGPLFNDCSAPVAVDVIPGACMLLLSETFRRSGMFDSGYFMYGEDIDLNYRVRKLGLVNYYIGKARIVHHGGKSSSRHKVSQWSTLMKYTAMARLMRLQHGDLYSLLYRVAMGLSAMARVSILALVRPLLGHERVQNSIIKWATVFKWSCGIIPPEI